MLSHKNINTLERAVYKILQKKIIPWNQDLYKSFHKSQHANTCETLQMMKYK